MVTGRGLKLAAIGLGTLITPLDTAVNIAFPAITGSFGLPIPAIQWVVICYVLTYSSLMLACGRIGDLVGHVRVFRLGLAVSVAGYLLCGTAPDYALLLLARVIQGVGAALVISCGPALVTGLYPEEQRARMLGVYALIFAVGAALGPSLGGLLVQLWDWPAVFWFRAPLAAASLLLLRGMPAPPRQRGAGGFDLAGALLLALSLVGLLLGLSRLRYLEEDLGALPLIATGAALAVGFVWRQRRAASPIIDLAAFRLPGFTAINLGNVLVNLASFAVLLLVPYYLVRYTGLPVWVCGALLASSPIGTAVASPLGGSLLGRVRPVVAAAPAAGLVALALAAIGLWGPEPNLVLIVGSLFLQGFGQGLFQVASMEMVTGAMPRRDRGVAGSLSMLTRTLGVVSGATLLSLMFDTLPVGPTETRFLPAFGWTFWTAALLPTGVTILLLLPGQARWASAAARRRRSESG